MLEPMEMIENKGERTENGLVCPVPSGKVDLNYGILFVYTLKYTFQNFWEKSLIFVY